MNKQERHRLLLDNLGDDLFIKPVKELTSFESDVLVALLRGPLADEVIERIDNINESNT